MANALYGKGKEKLLSGAIDITTATMKASILSSAYSPNLSTDEFYSTISANVLNTPQTLAIFVIGFAFLRRRKRNAKLAAV